MTVYNFGSVNIDHVLRVPRHVEPGETLAAHGSFTGLGGKGANQSVAVARAGVEVLHIGAIGHDGDDAAAGLSEAGVDLTWLQRLETPSGRAQIMVDDEGENAIIILAGANADVSLDHLQAALSDAAPGDILMLQNETPHQAEAARFARGKGMHVIYSAAPFEAAAVKSVLDHVSLLLVNEVEAAQLTAALDMDLSDIPVPAIVVTKGPEGAVFHDLNAGTVLERPSHKVDVVDTTGAGDCFAGYLAAGLDRGLDVAAALELALAAAALAVTRPGATAAIPTGDEVTAFHFSQAGR
ncbi:MAG: ribokinase [Pseudomonadota bacterium]